MSFGHALYYPYINLTDKNWIKHALLFYDKISRIIPTSLEPQDSETVIEIKYNSNFINDYHPDRYDTSSTFNEFAKIITHPIFRERINLHPLSYSKGTFIHIEKLDYQLKEVLIREGYASPGTYGFEDWLIVNNDIGMLYMTFFAKTISKRTLMPVVTDVELLFSASMKFEPIINSDYKGEFEYRLGNLLIETVVPKKINNVSIDKIMDIREKYSDERTTFFNEISNLTNSIPDIDNASALNDALDYHSKLILKETKNIERLYNTNKIETVNKFLSISTPTTIASLSDYVPDVAKPMVVAGGIIFGLVSSVNAVKKEKLELKANPKSYLLNLKSELSGGDIFSRINDSIKGIRKW